MKIAIDISPLSNENKVRGVGFYLLNLKNEILKNFKEDEFIFFSEKLTESADVVFYPYFDPFRITLPIFKKIPTVVTIHDLTPIIFKKHFPAGVRGNLVWEIQKKILKNVDLIITDSNSSKKDIIKLAGIKENKVKVVYLSEGDEFRQIKDKKQLLEVKNKYNLPDKFGLYVGDVTWNKNLPRVTDAFKKTKIPLVMVGKALVDENFDRENIWNKDRIYVLENTKDKDQFIRLGFIPTSDLVAIYNLATFSITASLYEGFGLPILEAMRCGTPVVASSKGSISEVGGEDSVFYIDAEKEESIERGISEVFKNKSLQEKLSKKGLMQASKSSWKKTAMETIEAIKSIY